MRPIADYRKILFRCIMQGICVAAAAHMLFALNGGCLPASGPAFSEVVYAADILDEEPIEGDGVFNGYSYMQLSDDVKRIYSAIYKGISERKSDFTVRAAKSSDIADAINAILRDCPEFFWIDGTASMTGFETLGIWRVSIGFNVQKEDIDYLSSRIEERVTEYLNSLPSDAGDYTKTKMAYEYVINITDYLADSPQNQNIQSVFIYGKSVCAGYSRAFQYLLHRAGVYCAYIEGNIQDGDPDYGHAWNLVNVNGVDTYVDVSWGDPTYSGEDAGEGRKDLSYDYLCLTLDEMRRTGHVADESMNLPACADRSYDYYVLNGTYYEEYDRQRMSRAVWYAVDEAIGYVDFKFADSESYYNGMYALFPDDGEQSILDEPLQQRMAWDERSSMRYYYNCSDELYIIKVYW